MALFYVCIHVIVAKTKTTEVRFPMRTAQTVRADCDYVAASKNVSDVNIDSP